ncbi:BTB/POZ domain-containing protein 6-like, partial [Paramacrobiotus metropolitanus]|uniref:BTB/POZ domain-containing protein 6-like n=1 Tax=Paramacrobiotus metropolitanus TaxID=2943436 RepID=UPI002446286C
MTTSDGTNPKQKAAAFDIGTVLHAAFTSGDLCDVEFLVGSHYGEDKKIFRAHKTILSLRSPVFRALFYGSLPDPCERPVEVPDVHPEAFANMLSYLYADRVDLNRETVFPTLYCADRYDVPGLLDACFQFAIRALDVRSWT